MPRKIRMDVSLSIGFSNARHEDTLEFEVDDDTPESQLDDICEEEYIEWRAGYLEGGWARLEDDK